MLFLPNIGTGWVIEVFDEQWYFDPSGRLLSPKDPDTYDLCWCRSRETFRFCHRDRHRLPRVTNAEFLAGWEAASDLEICLHPAAPGGCSSDIIRAHTVQRMGGGLATIAVDGIVYGLKFHPRFFQKNDMRVVPEPIGTRPASTFRGFCGPHDAALFGPAEKAPFILTTEQLLLLNFRVIARRVYTKMIAVRHSQTMFEYDRGLPPSAQREFFAVQYRERLESEHHLRNISALKNIYDQRITRGDFANVNALVIDFSGAPELACAEIVNIACDFAGNRLEHPDPPAHLCAYTVGTAQSWSFVLSWVGNNSAAVVLGESLLAAPESEWPRLVLNYVLEHMDNVFFAPHWCNGLLPSEHAALVSHLTTRCHPHYIWDARVLVERRPPRLNARALRYRKIGPWAVAA